MQRLFAAILTALTFTLSPAALAADRAQIMSVEQARAAATKKSLLLIDIRRPEEWRESGVGDVAHPIDMTQPTFFKELMKLREANPDAQFGLICATGVRSRALASYMIRNGIKNVVDVSAGMHGRRGWLASKLPVKPAPSK
jgi:rhodanese-related sulfurtransferase